jgi:U6 snRNA-associated Sm-like protein LSm2
MLGARCVGALQIFLTFFKTLEGKSVVVEFKNDLQIRGTLQSVDQYLNLKLSDVVVVQQDRFPQLVRYETGLTLRCRVALPSSLSRLQTSVKVVFVRGSVIRYVHIPKDAVDTDLLQDAATKEATLKR